MSTADGMFSQYERQELNKITAKSILEKLMDIRQGIKDEFTARRLIWELIQNAKDNASLCNADGEKVDVFIEITESEFIFSHNKGYFTNEHIRGLIRKYSSSDKDRDVEHIDQVYKTTGRFGTGFMTTHLLSEKVHIESYYKNDQGKYNEFNFWLDRSGKDEKGIIRGINNAFEEAEDSIKNSPNVILEKEDFYTSFIYPLTDRKRNLAYIALEEVKNGIGFTLINVPEINSVTIDEDAIGTTVYKIKLVDTITYQDNEFYVYNLLIGGKKSKYSYLTINEGELQIIIPISDINNKFHVLELNSDIPRFHLDFPMTGTEDLHLPFIVNTPLFEPTEPRDGVSLIDDEENPIAQKNCEIVIRAVDLFIIFLSYIGKDENWNDLYNLARIKSPKKQPWIDSIWFNDNVVSKIRKELLYTPIVDVTNGDRIAILDDEGYYQVCFPYAEKDIIREKIWGLSMKIQPQFTPIKEHINKWHEIIWKDCYKFTLSELSEEIEDKENLENLTELLGEKEKNAIDFLNTYYDLLNLEENHIKDIIADKYKVIPNQLGEFIKKSELFVEQEIDEELINACSLVTEYPRQVLRHKAIITASNYDNIDSKLKYSIKNQESIIADINKIIKERKNQNISLVCDYLASLFPTNDIPQRRKLIFGFSKKIYPEDFTEKRKLKYYDEKIWEESDKNSLFYIVSKIAEFKTVTQAAEGLCFADENAFITWLDKLISFLVKDGFENNINRRDHPILPNQNGDFCTKDDLFLDDGETDEILKDISAELGHDFREELLDLSIILELPENRTYTIEDVAEKISASIKPIIRDVENRKEYKEDVLNCADIQEFITFWAKEKIGKLQKGSVKGFIADNKQIKDLNAIDSTTQNEIEKILQIRHLYSHRNGIVDEKFLKYFPSGYPNGSEHQMSIEEVLNKIEYLSGIVNNIDNAAMVKYSLSTFL
ncbi:hypothetical protein J2787_001060 [Chryseobacterium rhizosphaerae]|uniref:ATP-binding protein n=1 Tax=Chryseobacterium rhizosphaerae TaxID=395937 RepID=A0AAE3Y844_9FLAO|nr:ATP-binding protein [Chryseobacterium rhizosphaerae]MDR6525690.1 hypothetical protein [Chryseobacterium rhizosphaerae]